MADPPLVSQLYYSPKLRVAGSNPSLLVGFELFSEMFQAVAVLPPYDATGRQRIAESYHQVR